MQSALLALMIIALISVVGAFAWRKVAPRAGALKASNRSEEVRLAAFLAVEPDLPPVVGPARSFPQAATDGGLLPGPPLRPAARPAPADTVLFFADTPVRPLTARAPREAGPGSPETAVYRACVADLAAALRAAADDVERTAASSTDPAESAARALGALTAATGAFPVRQLVTASHRAARTGSAAPPTDDPGDRDGNGTV